MKGGGTATYFSFAKPKVGIFLKMKYPLSKTDLTPALLALIWHPLKCCPFKGGLLFLMTPGVIGSCSPPGPLRYSHPRKKADANSKQWSSPQPVSDISVWTSGHLPTGNWDRDELFSSVLTLPASSDLTVVTPRSQDARGLSPDKYWVTL